MDKDLLTNKLVREILARIFAGQYAIDARLPSERALGEEFHVSRGSIREALGILAQLGVIAIRRGSGAYVRSLSQFGIPNDYLPREIAAVDLQDILEARKAIETVAVELACHRMGAMELQGLERIVRRMEAELDDLPAFVKCDMAFHEAIVRGSRNAPLITAFEAIREYHRYFQVFSSRRDVDEQLAVDHHHRILEALRRRDPKGASRAIRRHLDAMRRNKTNGQQQVKRARSRQERGTK